MFIKCTLIFYKKRRSFDKYIKGKKDDKYNSNVLEYLAKYYQVSQREVRDYLEILKQRRYYRNIVKIWFR